MSASNYAVRISIDFYPNCKIVFNSSSGRSLTIDTDLSAEQISNQKKVLYGKLDQFRVIIGSGLIPIENIMKSDAAKKNVSRAFKNLHKIGSEISNNLFGIRRSEVQDYILSACPSWKLSGSDNFNPPIIEISSSLPYSLPFEFIPLFDAGEPPEIKDFTDIQSVASRFLGFSTVVSRRPKNIDNFNVILNANIKNRPKLKLRFFRHAGLSGVKIEEIFFKNQKWIDFHGPWPHNKFYHEDFVRKLANQLYNGYEDPNEEGVDQIQHFSCHCSTKSSNSSDYTLTFLHKEEKNNFHRLQNLLHPEGDNQWATLGELNTFFGMDSNERPKRNFKYSYPLVFLNACGASTLDPSLISSFPSFFLRAGNIGVIGPETKIPDLFAAEFSKSFYESFIRNSTLGQAIYKAKWQLLKKYLNPLGVLYSMYANPDLRVERFIGNR